MIIFYLFLLHVMCISWIHAEPIVQISQGKLNGTLQKSRNGKSYAAFLGIPYGQPPMGKLRFRSPLPAGNWSGIRAANAFRSVCPQFGEKETYLNEDCLFLNIFTPSLRIKNSTLLPVMVWIHGGEFNFGSGNYYSAEYLLDKDIILVTLNYRLGIFGFFTTGDSAAPGNFGLKDQVLALKWVQHNIKVFGGDPNRVTIFGQGAGGASVAFHALSKASNGLFHQYIIESSNCLSPLAYQNNSRFIEPVTTIAEILECPLKPSEKLVDCMREKDVYNVLDTLETFTLTILFTMLNWTPTEEPNNEDAFLTDSPKNLLENNQMKDLPFISGVVADEGLLFTESLYRSDFYHDYLIPKFKDLMSSISEVYLGFDDNEKFIRLVEKFYFNDSISSKVDKEFLKGITETLGDSIFIYPELKMLDRVTPKMKNSNYLYSFDFKTNPLDIGVSHSAELDYLFANQHFHSSVHLRISEIIVDLWTSFAINGKPTSEKFEQPGIWEPYNSETNNHLKIGIIGPNNNSLVALSNSFFTKRMKFWKEHFPTVY